MYNSLTPHKLYYSTWILNTNISVFIFDPNTKKKTNGIRNKIICYRPFKKYNHSMNWFPCFIWIGSRLHIDWRPFESFYHLCRNKSALKGPPIRPFIYTYSMRPNEMVFTTNLNSRSRKWKWLRLCSFKSADVSFRFRETMHFQWNSITFETRNSVDSDRNLTN